MKMNKYLIIGGLSVICTTIIAYSAPEPIFKGQAVEGSPTAPLLDGIQKQNTQNKQYSNDALNVVSSTNVNVVVLPAQIKKILEPQGQSLIGKQNIIYNKKAFQFMVPPGMSKVTFILTLENGHKPIVLNFMAEDVPAQVISIPVSVAGTAPINDDDKKGASIPLYEQTLIDITKNAIDNKMSESWTKRKTINCTDKNQGMWADIVGNYICAADFGKLATPNNIYEWENDNFGVMKLSVCSNVNNLHLSETNFHTDPKDMSITVVNHDLNKGQCAEAIIIRAKNSRQSNNLSELIKPLVSMGDTVNVS